MFQFSQDKRTRHRLRIRENRKQTEDKYLIGKQMQQKVQTRVQQSLDVDLQVFEVFPGRASRNSENHFVSIG